MSRALGLVALLAACVAAAAVQHDASVHAPQPSVLGFTPDQLQTINSELARHQHLLAPTNDTKFMQGTDGLLSVYFIRLQRLLHAMKVLPVSEFGRVPSDVHIPQDDWSNAPHIPRLGINKYWDSVKGEIHANSKCLEMYPNFYTRKHPNCTEAWTLDYEADPTKARIVKEKNTVYADLANYTSHSLNGLFDVILATNGLQYPAHPYRALTTLYNMLKPGGLLMTTQPFIERDITGGWRDNFRFTDGSMRGMLEATGFKVERIYRGGNLLLATSFLHGYAGADFSAEELEDVMRPAHAGDPIYFGTYVLARKPMSSG